MDEAQKEVLRPIYQFPQQEGQSIDALQRELRNLSIRTIKQAIDYLTVEGHIYPTVDGKHFKFAD